MSRFRLSLLTLALPLLQACSEAPAPAAAQAQPVRVISAGSDSRAAVETATGLVGSQEETRLGFKTGGLISRINVEAGTRIRQGQVLAALDTTEIDAQVRQASESLAKARRDVDRAEQLFRKGVIAEQVAQDARTQVALGEATLSAARFNRQHAAIIAPASGVVLQRLAEPREVAAPGAPVLVVSRDDLGWVLRVGLNDKAATRVRVGDPAQIRLMAYPEQLIDTVVKEIGAASDPRTGTVSVSLSLPQRKDLRLIAGQVGEAVIQPRSTSGQRITVPLGAILEGNGDQATVYVVGSDSKAARRAVTVGQIQEDRVEVVSGLRAGERVVSEGAAWLNPGAPVRILR